MINLETISKELARYKEAKDNISQRQYSDMKYLVEGITFQNVPIWWDVMREDVKFINIAKNTPLETYCEQLIEEIIALRAK